jgi:putative hydrolase of the HAD superfamily
VIETILFDLDDTLVAEMEWARGGWAVVARHLAPAVGRDDAEIEAMLAAAFDRDPRHVFDQLGAALRLGDDVVRDCVERYRTAPRPLTVLPDAAAALRFAAGRRTGIVTDGYRETQRVKVDCAGLGAAVEVIVYTDALGPGLGKPSPAGFSEALRLLGASASGAIYVADNAAKDFGGPRALGMRGVRVRRRDGVYRDVEPPPGGEPDALISSLDELPGLVSAWDDAVP